jgi:hypothetical protein
VPEPLQLLEPPTRVERAISKSKYISGLQCHKLLWHQYNAKELIPPVDESQQAVFNQGHEVGRRARQLYPGGVLVERERWDMDGLLEDTARALAAGGSLQGEAIYEAAFLGGGVYAQVDILVPTGDGRWDIVEVKSSTSVKSVYLDDVAVQRFAVESSGTPVRNCYVVHIDRDYVRSGDVDNHQLFRVVDVTSDVADRLPDVPGKVEALASVIRQSESPEIAIGPHCSKPYDCPLKPVCWSALPEGHLTKVVRGAARREIQVAADESQNVHVAEPQVRGFLDGLTYPLFFLDFETFGTAVPLLDGTRPYQQVPFQFSLHIRREPGGAMTHHGFLADDASDPRPQLLQWMHHYLESAGSIVVYFAGFETGRLAELARDFPAHAPWIEQIVARVVDLHAPFKAFDVYHTLQHGSTSIKAVLPALTGMGYEGMAIADGATASQSFLRMAFGPAPGHEPPVDVAKVRQDLEAYCALDTLAMVRILDALEMALGGLETQAALRGARTRIS